MSFRWEKGNAFENCKVYIEKEFKNLCKERGLIYDSFNEFIENLLEHIEVEIDSIEESECDCSLDDYHNWELTDRLKDEGYVIINAPSLKERYKIEAFMEKLKNDPYGPMIIL